MRSLLKYVGILSGRQNGKRVCARFLDRGRRALKPHGDIGGILLKQIEIQLNTLERVSTWFSRRLKTTVAMR